MKLSPPVFVILADVVERHAGLHYGPAEIDLFSEKVGARLTEAGFESALDYYYFLRYDADARRELDALVETLVVGETYFFRELDALRTAADWVAEVVRTRGTARVWCAACASGEEPISLAMLLDDRHVLDRVELVATDISSRALERAREGSWTLRSARMLSSFDAELARLGRRIVVGENGVTVDRSLVQAIDFRRVNLLRDEQVAALGTFDLVMCRNVLIYFSDETVREVVGRLVGAMRDEARLYVGASESLLRFGTSLRCEERHGSFFYVKDKR